MIKTKEIFLAILCHNFDRRNIAAFEWIAQIHLYGSYSNVLFTSPKHSIDCGIDCTPKARQGKITYDVA